MEQKEMVVVVDFGGQYNQLIARRVRENNVYCEVYPYNKALEKLKNYSQKVSSSQVVLLAYTKTVLPKWKRKYLNLAFQYWVCAMVCNLWHIH